MQKKTKTKTKSWQRHLLKQQCNHYVHVFLKYWIIKDYIVYNYLFSNKFPYIKVTALYCEMQLLSNCHGRLTVMFHENILVLRLVKLWISERNLTASL